MLWNIAYLNRKRSLSDVRKTAKYFYTQSTNLLLFNPSQPHYGPGVDPICQKWIPEIFLEVKTQPTLEDDKMIVICELIFRQCGIFDISETCRPPQPARELAFMKMYRIEMN
jgi:hypothetical protein